MWVFSEKNILRFLAVLSLVVAAVWVYLQPGFEPLLAVLGAVAAFITSFFVEDTVLSSNKLLPEVTLYDENCGSKAIDLANQRLRVSSAFGSYFTGLLEREQGYIQLSGQLECSGRKGQENLSPIQRILWALQVPKGARVFILAADGGMGKSTVASKLIRCLYDQEAVDMILGDSAKSERVDFVSGRVLTEVPGYRTTSDFYQRLCVQLGVPYENDELALKDIQRRLVNRRALIVVDNLEVVERGDQLLWSLHHITSRDIRAIVTTRKVIGFDAVDDQHMLVRLKPLLEPSVASEFLYWHINQHQYSHPDLAKLRDDVADNKKVKWLIERSGGIPLLMQLLLSDVARSSWDQIRQLPTLFGLDLLNFLYKARWEELKELSDHGLMAKQILIWVKHEQFDNRKITAKRLAEWAEMNGKSDQLLFALALLHERFLIVNNDLQKGSYAIFPSLSEFLQSQE